MTDKTVFDKALIQKYDHSGPRYTSYPTALQFCTSFSTEDYIDTVDQSNNDPIPTPLSLYFHIPFCNTICYYCACNKIVTKNHKLAQNYVNLLLQEIHTQARLYSRDRTVSQMHWGGGTPTFLSNEELRSILEASAQHFNIADQTPCENSIEVDPRTVDSARIHELYDMGFNRISFGVQDFDPQVQLAVNRRQDTGEIIDNINAAHSAGFKSVNLDLMYGLPKQTLKSFAATIEQTLYADPDRLAIYNYAHMPELFKPQRRINSADLPEPAEKLDMMQMAIERLQLAGYVYIGMDHFAKASDDLVAAQKDGSLRRNFQGYSTHADCDIVAMGVTAISQIGDSYCQNVKSLSEYEDIVLTEQVPVYRGITLEPDDILRREIINQLMCHFRLDIKSLEKRWNIAFTTYFDASIKQLKEMETDGLLQINNDFIEITARGRLLVRNICMVFDRYLQERRMEEQYSRAI